MKKYGELHVTDETELITRDRLVSVDHHPVNGLMIDGDALKHVEPRYGGYADVFVMKSIYLPKGYDYVLGTEPKTGLLLLVPLRRHT